MSGEDLYIKNVENAIRAIKLRTKEPKETKIGYHLNKLKEVNEGMYQDYLAKYKITLEDYNKTNNK